MAVLDSSFLIDVLHGEEGAVRLLNTLQQRESKLLVASPTVMELWEGILRCKLPEKEKEKVEALLYELTILPFHEKEAKIAAKFRVLLAQQGETIELIDILIASITQAQGETIVTRDKHFTRIPELFVLTY